MAMNYKPEDWASSGDDWKDELKYGDYSLKNDIGKSDEYLFDDDINIEKNRNERETTETSSNSSDNEYFSISKVGCESIDEPKYPSFDFGIGKYEISNKKLSFEFKPVLIGLELETSPDRLGTNIVLGRDLKIVAAEGKLGSYYDYKTGDSGFNGSVEVGMEMCYIKFKKRCYFEVSTREVYNAIIKAYNYYSDDIHKGEYRHGLNRWPAY